MSLPSHRRYLLAFLKSLSLVVLFGLTCLSLETRGAASWQIPLARMPLPAGIHQLNRTNCVEIMLQAFTTDEQVKALIFMPGATDEFYMFHRAKALLTNSSPSLLDAVVALTNQTLIRATFYSPFLLLHTDEDPIEPLLTIENKKSAEKLRSRQFLPHVVFNDRDWDFVQPKLAKSLKATIIPGRHRYSTWHFYRHSFAAWNLDGWEALEAVALAGKTAFHVQKSTFLGRPTVLFEGDERVRATPRLDGYSPDK